MEKVLKMFFSQKCFNCGSFGSEFCYSCLNKCKISRSFYCLCCDKPVVLGKTHSTCINNQKSNNIISAVWIFSAFEYSSIVRNCIKTAKYRGKVFAPLKILSLEASKLASKAGITLDGYTVVSIPLSKRKSRTRGFNQAEVIAKTVSTEFGLVYQGKVLCRNKETSAQYKKNREERFLNLRGAFICKENLNGRKILLVDDICTTGATLLEASTALYLAGAKEVACFTLAKKF